MKNKLNQNYLICSCKRNIASVRILAVLILLAGIILLSSCTPHRKIVYLQHNNEISDTLRFNRPEHRIRPGDILHIRIHSLDENSNAIFNPQGGNVGSIGGGGASNLLIGNLINAQGETVVPVLGNVKLGGKTIAEARVLLEELVAQYIIGATVAVNLINFSITVTGEVRSPGRFNISENKATIIDAITMAGDLTDFGNRKVNIIRQTEDGTGATFAILNLTDPNIITSEYFFLQPNDIVYVEPSWVKRIGFVQTPFSVFLSALTTTMLLINYFR